MVLADSSYPLLNLFWTMCILFLWVIWIWILIWVFIDIFRSHDLSGGAKALWFVFVLFIPVIGVLVYLIVRGGSMSERAAAGRGLAVGPGVPQLHPASRSGLTGQYGGPADHKLAEFRDQGVIPAEGRSFPWVSGDV
jgi:Phospholipase_D-nuclease N-terminal